MARNYKERPCAGDCGATAQQPEGWLCPECTKALLVGRKLKDRPAPTKQLYALDRWERNAYSDLVHLLTAPIRAMKMKHRIGHTKDEVHYEPELNARHDAFLHYLTELGFVWEWEGWDQEPRLIASGLVRVPGTKIVQRLDGEYVISPRCHYCGQKTGWCRCSEDLDEIIEEAGRKHTCNDCYYRREFEQAKAEYLKTGTIPQGILDDLLEMINEGDWEEVQFENDADAVAFLGKRYGGEQIEVEWYEIIEKNWTAWTYLQDQHLEDAADDLDGYCECPLGA